MNYDLGMIINSGAERVAQSLEAKLGTLGAGPKMSLAGSHAQGLRSSHRMIQATPPGNSWMNKWATEVKRCTGVGGRDCPRFVKIATSVAARISRKKWKVITNSFIQNYYSRYVGEIVKLIKLSHVVRSRLRHRTGGSGGLLFEEDGVWRASYCGRGMLEEGRLWMVKKAQ